MRILFVAFIIALVAGCIWVVFGSSSPAHAQRWNSNCIPGRYRCYTYAYPQYGYNSNARGYDQQRYGFGYYRPWEGERSYRNYYYDPPISRYGYSPAYGYPNWGW